MSEILSNVTRADNRAANKQIEISSTSFIIYIDDNTDPEEPKLTEEDFIDSPLEAEEESEDYSDEYYSSSESFSIQPIWILYEGQILWSASRYGFNLTSKEYFRRRLQILLDFLVRKFPGKSYGDLLLSLQGFFAKDNTDSKGHWLASLKNSGIIYFDELTKKYNIISLGNFRAGKGQGKILPEKIESLWLENEFSKINLSGNQGKFKNYKASLIESFKNFCSELNDLCSLFASDSEDDNEENKRGIGLKKIEFIYEDSTLDRKKFNSWKKLWELWSGKK